MPKVIRRRAGPVGYLILAILAVGLIYLVWLHPFWVSAAIIALVALGFVETRNHRRKMARLAAQRPLQGGICDFSRAFDLRRTDPWVVRAVYEELDSYLRGIGVTLQIGPDDNLLSDLGIDPEDLDMDIAPDIAQRAGRSLKSTEQNPYYAKVKTARTLVLFFDAQPKECAT